MKDCQKEDREDVTREDEDRWCQKQVQVLNAIFRPVGKIYSPFLGVPEYQQECRRRRSSTMCLRQ